MADQFNLSGRVALVTGAGQNVGTGIAITLAEHGAQVLVNDLVSDRARVVAESIGDSAQPLTFDVTDLPAVERALDGVGPVDILVNNAGVAPNMAMVPFRESEPAAWRGPLELNSIGVMNCAKAVIEGMCSRRWGRIITISSGAGTAGTRLGVAPYAAGKGAGIAFTRTLALGTWVSNQRARLDALASPPAAFSASTFRTRSGRILRPCGLTRQNADPRRITDPRS